MLFLPRQYYFVEIGSFLPKSAWIMFAIDFDILGSPNFYLF